MSKTTTVELSVWKIFLWDIPWLLATIAVLILAALTLTGFLSVACWVIATKMVVGGLVGFGKGIGTASR